MRRLSRVFANAGPITVAPVASWAAAASLLQQRSYGHAGVWLAAGGLLALAGVVHTGALSAEMGTPVGGDTLKWAVGYWIVAALIQLPRWFAPRIPQETT